MFTSAFMFYCSSLAGAKFGFGEVEKGDSNRDWFSWTAPCCEVLKCNWRCCACILCCTVRYYPKLAFLSVPEKCWVLGDRWRCANAWMCLVAVMLLGSSSSFSQEALKHLLLFWHLVILSSRDSSSEKCSSERGKTFKSRNFIIEREGGFIEMEWLGVQDHQDPVLKPQILKSLIVLVYINKTHWKSMSSSSSSEQWYTAGTSKAVN